MLFGCAANSDNFSWNLFCIGVNVFIVFIKTKRTLIYSPLLAVGHFISFLSLLAVYFIPAATRCRFSAATEAISILSCCFRAVLPPFIIHYESILRQDQTLNDV